MGMNGIPRAFSPSQFRQEFLDFKRKVEQQLSGRTYVNLANITVTEGGTIDSGVGDQLAEALKGRMVIDGGSLAEGALDGQRMVGVVIENVDLLGNVKVNGAALGIQHAEFTAAFSLPSGTTNRRPSTLFTPDNTATVNSAFVTPAEAGAITLAAGVYAITYRADCGAPMGAQGRLAILNSDETRTHINQPIPNEWDGSLTIPNLYLPTTQKVVFTVKQTSGQSLNCNIRVAIEKMK